MSGDGQPPSLSVPSTDSLSQASAKRNKFVSSHEHFMVIAHSHDGAPSGQGTRRTRVWYGQTEGQEKITPYRTGGT
jgi:hypothetical protein